MEKRRKVASCCLVASLILGCALLSPVMLFFGFSSLYADLRLNDHGVSATADVLDTKIWSDSGTERYQVKYVFRTEDGGQYSCADSVGRHDLWCTITKVGWRELQTTKQVEVRYLPENPWINRMEMIDPPPSLTEPLVAILMGIAPWVLLVYACVLKKKNKLWKDVPGK
jgi:hypothetical protein